TNFIVTNGLNTYTTIAHNTYGTNATNVVSATLPSSVTLQWDLNGNLTNDGTRVFVCDGENRLVTNYVANTWKTEFVYDGLGRRRIERDYGWQSGNWSKTNELHLIYDGFLLVEVRDGNNNVLWTYTRGLDLSGTLAGAGGIGGLLARSDTNGPAFYHADGAGNVTALMTYSELVPARYLYSPFGKLVAMQGPLGPVNEMQFSSMPVNGLSDIVQPPLRPTYDPGLQRFLTQDPIGEAGGINLYRFVGNSPLAFRDPYGLDFHAVGSYGLFAPGPVSYLSGDTDLEALGAGMYNILPEAENVALDAAAGAASLVKGLFDLLDWGSEQSGLTGLMGASPSDTLAAMPFVVPELGLLDFAGQGERCAVLGDEAQGGLMATREGLIDVSQHLSSFGADPANAAMYSRLTTAFENGQALTGADAAFYQHELVESLLMDAGMEARAAHLETLSQQGILYAPGYEAQLYHPMVIQQFPAWFSPAAQAAAGVH
ncbi:MAG TPA: RHS repeat-associated core domain-containing protein, partial [Verrucomicrobiae bacterium]|nr:RHS repeat-associated core domain-containing protein [Verrucomicrobiae bacterium]